MWRPLPTSQGLLTPTERFKRSIGDGVRAPGVCDDICGDFAEVVSLAGNTGGAPADMVPPVVMGGTAIAGRSQAEVSEW